MCGIESGIPMHTHNWTKSSASVFRISTGAHFIPGNPISYIVQFKFMTFSTTEQVSIPFDSKCRDSHTRSHSLSSSSIMLIGIHSPFLWNLIPCKMLQIAKSAPFQLALHHFLLNWSFNCLQIFAYTLCFVIIFALVICCCLWWFRTLNCTFVIVRGSMFAGIANCLLCDPCILII